MTFLKRRQAPKSLPTEPQVYPVGSAVRTESSIYYIKDEKTRMRIQSEKILESWNFHRVIPSNELSLKNYRILGKLGFRSGSLIHNVADGKIYLVEKNKLRHVQSVEALNLIGAVYDDAVSVSLTDIQIHDIGEPLS